MSKYFNKIIYQYNLGYIRLDQLARYVELNVITKEEYKIICGLNFGEIL